MVGLIVYMAQVGDGEDKDLILWQVLLQVVNHGLDPQTAK